MAKKSKNKTYILEPRPIAKQCYLVEALYWVAFGIYPLYDERRTYYTSYTTNLWEEIYTSKFYQTILREIAAYFSIENCKRFSLPKALAHQILITKHSADLYLSLDSYNPLAYLLGSNVSLKLKENTVYNTVQRMLKLETLGEDIISRIENYRPILLNSLEKPQFDLFHSLMEGKLTSYGLKIKETDERYCHIIPDLYEGKKTKWTFRHRKITKNFWEGKIFQNQNIDWIYSRVSSEKLKFTHILVNTQELFSLFPEPYLKPQKKGIKIKFKRNKKPIETDDGKIKLTSIDKEFILDESILLSDWSIKFTKRGRKPTYNVTKIQAELLRMQSEGELPSTTGFCLRKIKKWCPTNLEKIPSDSSLKAYIRPFYK